MELPIILRLQVFLDNVRVMSEPFWPWAVCLQHRVTIVFASWGLMKTKAREVEDLAEHLEPWLRRMVNMYILNYHVCGRCLTGSFPMVTCLPVVIDGLVWLSVEQGALCPLTYFLLINRFHKVMQIFLCHGCSQVFVCVCVCQGVAE